MNQLLRADQTPFKIHPVPRSPHVLVMDISASVAELLTDALRLGGYQVTHCLKHDQLVPTIQTLMASHCAPDVLLLDLSYPLASSAESIEIMETMKRMLEQMGIATIILTTNPLLALPAIAAGLSVLIKPFRVRDLHNYVQRALAHSSPGSAQKV